MTFQTLQKFNQDEANPFDVVHTSSDTYVASDRELVITEANEVSLPAPEENAIVGIRDTGQRAVITSPSGQIHLREDRVIRAEETVYFVSDGTNWYTISDSEWFGAAILDSVVDQFDSGDLSAYGGDTGNYSVITSPTFEGDFALSVDDDDTTNFGVISSTSGLDSYPEAGQRISCRVRFDSDRPSGREGEQLLNVDFATQAESSDPDRYRVGLDMDGDELSLLRREDSSTASIDSSGNVNFPFDEWLRVQIDWETNGAITATVFEGEDRENETELGSVSGEDATFSEGGIGFSSRRVGGYYDYYIIEEEL